METERERERVRERERDIVRSWVPRVGGFVMGRVLVKAWVEVCGGVEAADGIIAELKC